MAEPPPYPGAPLWVKVFGTIVIVVVLLFVGFLVTRGPGGHHGPGMHIGGGGAKTPSSSGVAGPTPPKQP